MSGGLAFLLILVSASAGPPPRDLYVSTAGSDSNPGTRSAPFRTIPKADLAAGPGTTVHVAPGTYTGGIVTNANGAAGALVRFVSEGRWRAKIVPGTNDTAWWSKGSYVEVAGFEIDGSRSAVMRAGLYMTGSHSAARGNHVHNIAEQVPCTNNGGSAIEGDSWYGGSDIDIEGNVVHDIGRADCRFIQGIYQTATGNIVNNLVFQVKAAAIHLWHDAHHINIANNTVFGSNVAILVGGGDYVRGHGPDDYTHVFNNIVYDNAIGIVEHGGTGTHNTYSCNLVFRNGEPWRLQNNLADTNTVTTDPLFIRYVNAGGGDYRLRPGSPAIDKGCPSDAGVTAPATDLDGRRRPLGAGFDIGAYEHDPS